MPDLRRKPLRTPIWQFFNDSDIGLQDIMIGNLVIYRKKLYYMDNYAGLDENTSVAEAIINENLKEFVTGTVMKTKLNRPGITKKNSTVIPRAGQEITLKITNFDIQAQSYQWEITGVSYSVTNGALQGTKYDEITLRPGSSGRMMITVKAVAPQRSDFMDSDISATFIMDVQPSQKPKLIQPTLNSNSNRVISEGDEIILNVGNIDNNATELKWSIMGVGSNYEVVDGNLTSVLQSLRLKLLDSGEVTIRVAVKGNPDIYEDSDYSNQLIFTINKKAIGIPKPTIEAKTTGNKINEKVAVRITNIDTSKYYSKIVLDHNSAANVGIITETNEPIDKENFNGDTFYIVSDKRAIVGVGVRFVDKNNANNISQESEHKDVYFDMGGQLDKPRVTFPSDLYVGNKVPLTIEWKRPSELGHVERPRVDEDYEVEWDSDAFNVVGVHRLSTIPNRTYTPKVDGNLTGKIRAIDKNNSWEPSEWVKVEILVKKNVLKQKAVKPVIELRAGSKVGDEVELSTDYNNPTWKIYKGNTPISLTTPNSKEQKITIDSVEDLKITCREDNKEDIVVLKIEEKRKAKKPMININGKLNVGQTITASTTLDSTAKGVEWEVYDDGVKRTLTDNKALSLNIKLEKVGKLKINCKSVGADGYEDSDWTVLDLDVKGEEDIRKAWGTPYVLPNLTTSAEDSGLYKGITVSSPYNIIKLWVDPENKIKVDRSIPAMIAFYCVDPKNINTYFKFDSPIEYAGTEFLVEYPDGKVYKGTFINYDMKGKEYQVLKLVQG